MYIDVEILNTSDFLQLTAGFNPQETDVEMFAFSAGSAPQTFTFYYKNAKQPQYCTILAERYILFDGYESIFDSTLQGSKTQVYGETIPVFLLEDDFIPDLDEEVFPLLYNEAKSLAFVELKQTPHSKAEQENRRQWSATQKRKSVVNRPTDFDALPDFGKRSYNGISFFRSMGWRR
jgi:hypothetical protein